MDVYDYRFSDAGLTTWVLLRQTWTALFKVAEAKLRKTGLSPEQLDVLWSCMGATAPLTPAEISRRIFRESQTVTGLLDRLERDGLLVRIPKRKGRPFTQVQLTPAGQKACEPAIGVAKELITRLMSVLSEEEHKQLQELLRVLFQKGVEELHLESGPPPAYASGEVIPVV